MSEIRTITVDATTFDREFKVPGKTFSVFYFSLKCTDQNGDKLEGSFSTNSGAQTKFLTGNTYEVEIETKSNNQGEYLFFNYTKDQKETAKKSNTGPKKRKGGYARSMSEIRSIISQSSYHNAVRIIEKLGKDKFTDVKQVTLLSKQICSFVFDKSGLSSKECQNEVKDFVIEANGKSIVLQKAFDIASTCIDWPNFEPLKENEKVETRLFRIVEEIANEINAIANGL